MKTALAGAVLHLCLGTPGISDPGSRVVKAAQDVGRHHNLSALD